MERLGLHHNKADEIIGHEKVGNPTGAILTALLWQKSKLVDSVKYERLKTEIDWQNSFRSQQRVYWKFFKHMYLIKALKRMSGFYERNVV